MLHKPEKKAKKVKPVRTKKPKREAKQKPRKTLSAAESYFAQGEAWGQEIFDKMEVSRKLGWYVAGMMGALLGCSVLAIVALTPLKSVETVYVLADKSTGYMQQIVTVGNATLTQNEALAEANIATFIRAHEIWDPTDFDERFDYVRYSTNQEVYTGFLKAINKRGETMKLEDDRHMFIKTLSHNPQNQTAYVRISTETIVKDFKTVEHWAVTLKYEYTSTPTNRDVALLNPLGFKVTSYRVDQELSKGE